MERLVLPGKKGRLLSANCYVCNNPLQLHNAIKESSKLVASGIDPKVTVIEIEPCKKCLESHRHKSDLTDKKGKVK